MRDTRFPIAATLIIPQIVGGSANSPDFDLYLLNPSGTTVAQSAFTTRQEELGFLPTVTGTYTVRVRSFRGSGGFFVDISAGLNDPAYVRAEGRDAGARVAGAGLRAHARPGAPTARTGRRSRTRRATRPRRSPGQLTVGTPDANSQTANFCGFVRLNAIAGDPATGPGRGRRGAHRVRPPTCGAARRSPTTRASSRRGSACGSPTS